MKKNYFPAEGMHSAVFSTDLLFKDISFTYLIVHSF